MQTNINTVEGNFIVGDARFAIVCARFNHFIVDSLEIGAIDALKRHGVADESITVYKAPGAYELPLLAKRVAEKTNVDAVIVLGAVIRGGTAHFDYVCGPCASDIAKVALDTGKPLAFGVLTVDSIEQAIERAGTKAGNKGAEAALTAIEMVSLFKQIEA